MSKLSEHILPEMREWQSTPFVSYKHLKKFMKLLKSVYQANTEKHALNRLVILKDKWDKQYPSAVRSREED